ncbi:MAG: hypothetical protein MI924_06175 [Chloroflexales bacterium]|nr:hypothetical protein [Chloroflexales bacterium]
MTIVAQPEALQDAPNLLLCSLRDLQRQRYMTDKEFARALEIDEKTLRRLNDPDQRHSVSVVTKRRVAAKLGRPPHTIAELLWTPSEVYLAAVDARFAEAQTLGVVAADPATGRPTGRRVPWPERADEG